MALVNCHECGKEVSTEAKACPSCGATVQKPVSSTKKLLLGLLAVAVIGGAVSEALKSPAQKAVEKEGTDKAAAFFTAVGSCTRSWERQYLQFLKDPASLSWDKEHAKVGKRAIKGTVKRAAEIPYRAKNGFGGNVVELAVCELDDKNQAVVVYENAKGL